MEAEGLMQGRAWSGVLAVLGLAEELVLLFLSGLRKIGFFFFFLIVILEIHAENKATGNQAQGIRPPPSNTKNHFGFNKNHLLALNAFNIYV